MISLRKLFTSARKAAPNFGKEHVAKKNSVKSALLPRRLKTTGGGVEQELRERKERLSRACLTKKKLNVSEDGRNRGFAIRRESNDLRIQMKTVQMKRGQGRLGPETIPSAMAGKAMGKDPS